MNKIKAILTIDDGPSSSANQKVDFLSHYHIPAIFFCIGNKMEENRNAILYAINKGCIIGNHSYAHSSFKKHNSTEAIMDIEKTDRIIDLLYNDAGIKRQVKLFRFPCGARPHGNEIQIVLKKLGYTQLNAQNLTIDPQQVDILNYNDILWTFDTAEYRILLENERYPILSKEDIMRRIDGHFGDSHVRYDEIIVMHDWSETNDLFIGIIELLLKKGVVFIDPLERAKI